MPHTETVSQPTSTNIASPTPPRENDLDAWVRFLRLLYYLFIALALAGLAWYFRRPLLAALDRAWRWLASCFPSRRAGPAYPSDEALEPAPPTFADFHDPFAWGTARERPLSEVVTYSFAALEAWARDHACARDPQQTPSEFAGRLGRHTKPLAAPARDFAQLYAVVAYAGSAAKPEAIVLVERLWEALGAADASRGREESVAGDVES